MEREGLLNLEWNLFVFYLRAELGLNPVEVVVQVTALHQVTSPGSQLGYDPRSLGGGKEKCRITAWKNVFVLNVAFIQMLEHKNIKKCLVGAVD